MNGLAIVGYGRSGKDTAGRLLGEISVLGYGGSTSNVVLPLIAKELRMSEEKAWNTRHQNRDFWKKWCDEYRKDDPTKLISLALKKARTVVGIRGAEELAAGKACGLISMTVWISNHRVPVDPTVEFTSAEADVIIHNDSDYPTFYRRLYNFVKFAGLLKE